MQLLNTYLEKFKKITPPDKVIREQTSAVVYQVTGITIHKKNITIQKSCAHIKISGNKKTKIFLNKKNILKHLKDELGDKAPLDIR